MMSHEIKYIEDFIANTKQQLQKLVADLEWKEDVDYQEKVCCHVDSRHWVPQFSLSKHIELCSWLKDGYQKEEIDKALPSSHFCYKNSTSVVPILIDKELQERIFTEANVNEPGINASGQGKVVPKTMDRGMIDLTSQERLAIYNFVVSKAKATNKPTDVTVEDLLFDFENKNDKDEKPKSHLEILAEQRDYKRRRPSYRAKNVHITKKSYTEIMREVIENQVSYLTQTEKQNEVSINERSEQQNNTEIKLHESDEVAINRCEDKGEKEESDYQSKSSSNYKPSSRSRDKHSRNYPYKRHHHKRSRSSSRERHRHSDAQKGKQRARDEERRHREY